MDEKLARHLLATFQQELVEHVRGLNENLLALEKDPRGAGVAERVKSLFRAAHSLKGAARSVGIRPIEEMCHHLEEVLRALQEGGLAAEGELFALLYRAADALDDASARIASGRETAGGPLEAVGAVLMELGKKHPKRGTLPRPASSAPIPPPAEGPSSDGFVRVPMGRLDSLLARSGELLVAERRLEAAQARASAASDLLGQVHTRLRKRASRSSGVEEPLRGARVEIERLGAALREDRRAIGQAASLLDEEVRRTRLSPFGEACQGLERAVRDLAKEQGKEVDLVVEGGATELDRSILEGLKDPLLCLVRNAIGHGIEEPRKRRSSGKPERGRVLVKAELRGARAEISVADDGAGIDLTRVRDVARKRGVTEPRDDQDCIRLLFEPGFSTAEGINAISGRGVGLDIVRNRIEALHGTADLSFEPGRGTRVAALVPITLTTIRALIVSTGGEIFAIPGASVVRLIRFSPEEVKTVGGREVIPTTEGLPVPIFPLARILGLPERQQKPGKILAVMLGGHRSAAFAVDELLAEREILVKGLGRRLRSLRSVAGATILETGRVALILNIAELTRSALARPGNIAFAPLQDSIPRRKTILLADDSVTTRSLERAILESAGYQVLTAVDGEDAWRILQERGADMVVSDIDMPRLDGLALCRAIRASKRFRDLPVALVTALHSEQDRARGADAGADAYIVKSGFDQRDLLATIATLLGGAA